jgi:ribosomal protein L20
MESDRAQLSALATTLDDLTRRIVDIANGYRGTQTEHIALGLDQVERNLNTAARQLAKTMRAMRT